MDGRVTHVEHLDLDEMILTVQWKRGRFWQLLDILIGLEPSAVYELRYRGSCTVWHEYPGGERAPTYLEAWLCDRWTRLKWQKERKD